MCTFLGEKVKYAICDKTPPNSTPNVVYMSAQVFRYPKSSNGIEISRFIQVLLNFDWFRGSTPFGGVGVDGWGWDSVRMFGGSAPCTCACARAYMYKHDIFMQMAAPIGKSWGIPYDIIAHAHARVCMHVCAHAHMHGAPLQTPWQSTTPIHPPPPPEKGGLLESVKIQ